MEKEYVFTFGFYWKELSETKREVGSTDSLKMSATDEIQFFRLWVEMRI